MKNRKIGIMGLGICLLLAGCSFGENKNKGGDPSTPQPTATEASSKVTTNTTETKKVTEKPTEATMSNEQSVSIVSHSVVKDKTGSEVLLIEYSWTNNSDKETSFMVACRDSVYQNGIECPSYSAMLDEVDSTQQMVDIKPGATLNLKIGYTLQDNTNALVEVMDILGKDYYLKETIELGGGEGKTSNEPSVTAETTVKIAETFLSKDYKGKDVLVVKYEFTNGEDRARAFSTTFDDKVYQNGVECSSLAVFCDDVDSNTTLASVKRGVTLIVEEGYLLNDKKTDVEIEVKEIFGNKVYLSEKRSLK